MTAIPLIMFGTAAKLLPLRFIGFIQYMTPIIQFCIAIFIFHEPMPAARWAGFALVWAGLSVLIVDGIRAGRRQKA
jgi:chloramphenicol-sensitive protein RarD